MTCELWRDQIDSYIDGELSLNHEASFANHLRNCPACNGLTAETIHLKRVVAKAGRRYQPTAEFREQIVRSIGGKASRTRVWLQLALVAAMMVVIVAGLLVMRRNSNDLDREIADVHLNAVASANPVDVVSSDMHTVKPWFQGRLPFSFNVPELAGSPFSLIGGRVVYVHGSPCALLLFQYRLHRISTLVGSPAALGRGNHERTLPTGFHVVRFEKDDLEVVTIGDASESVISDLAGRVRTAQQ